MAKVAAAAFAGTEMMRNAAVKTYAFSAESNWKHSSSGSSYSNRKIMQQLTSGQ